MSRPGPSCCWVHPGMLVVATVPRWTYAVPYRAVIASEAEGPSIAWTIADAGGMVANPHSDLIFRATGATTCLDCHRAGKDGTLSPQVQDNALVQELKAKAKGVHGPGRFADCLRCHAGGNKGVEKYRK
jgi:cytochrome c2